jgi:hypothetical protein
MNPLFFKSYRLLGRVARNYSNVEDAQEAHVLAVAAERSWPRLATNADSADEVE